MVRLVASSLSLSMIIISSVVFPLCFLLFYLLHANEATLTVNGYYQIPTLSLTGGFFPEQAIFTGGLYIFAILSATFFTILYDTYCILIKESANPIVVKANTWYVQANYALLIVGYVFSALLFIVGSIPITQAEYTHAVLAILMFVVGSFHVLFFYFAIGLQAFVNVERNKWHFAAVILIVPVNFFLLVLAGLLYLVVLPTKYQETRRDILIAANQATVITEYTTVIALLLYIEGFRRGEFGLDQRHIHMDCVTVVATPLESLKVQGVGSRDDPPLL